ncbi:MAG: primosomal protein N' [Oscillospiraceae bacterium]|nr:primosomal protein N' [Oscillospiraceae bacterium]
MQHERPAIPAGESSSEKNDFLLAKIVVETSVYHFDQEFFYEIPKDLLNKLKPGCRVLVPFGVSNKHKIGMVLSIEKFNGFSDIFQDINAKNNDVDMSKIKQIFELIDETPIFNQEFISLVKYMKEKYYCTYFDAIKTILPNYISKKKKKLIKIVNISPTADLINIKMTESRRSVLDIISKKGELSFKEIFYFTGTKYSVIELLIKKGILECRHIEEKTNFFKGKLKDSKDKLILTPDQEKAYKDLCCSYLGKNKISLLYGITGSGKTSVFIKMIEKIRKKGREVIVMVPEIALTPQITSIFYSHFGKEIAIFHSYLSDLERFDQWNRVKNGEAKIVIGTRSAVFAPFEDIGLIILDEEQESSYKSESTPRYHAREIAKFRCKYHNAMLILSSATPSVESFYAASTGRYRLIKLAERYGNAKLPEVSVVDMNLELLNGNSSIFSRQLICCLNENVKSKKQSILLLNRRGYNTFVTCRSCKKVMTCRYCSISMTYHKTNNMLMCHYCGYSVKFDKKCTECGELQVCCSGIGTQKVEQELQELIPKAKIMRMDADTTMKVASYEKTLSAFANLEFDILVGTQMVAKGLDFPNVTLVGVLSSDASLYSSDFRSYEKTFALLTQVVGRSGRGAQPGKAIVQTLTPENPIIGLAAEQNYEEFYKTEIKIRKAMLYPPFTSICVVGFLGNLEIDAINASNYFFELLISKAKNEHKELPLRVLGPSPALIFKMSNKYRYKIIIKFRNCKEFRNLMAELKMIFQKNNKYKHVTLFIDGSPHTIF